MSESKLPDTENSDVMIKAIAFEIATETYDGADRNSQFADFVNKYITAYTAIGKLQKITNEDIAK